MGLVYGGGGMGGVMAVSRQNHPTSVKELGDENGRLAFVKG